MGKKLYVGNLSADTTAADLEALFSQVGPCLSATVVTDRVTGQSRGFGFVEMSSDNDAQKAIAQVNGKALKGQALKVNEARERSLSGAGGRPRGPGR